MSFMENHPDPLVELVRELTNPEAKIYTSLAMELHSVQDNVLVLGDDNLPKETAKYCWKPSFVQVDFVIWVPSAPLVASELMGKITRSSGENYEFLKFSPKVMLQLKHQTGLRLQRVMQSQRETYFNSALLGYNDERVSGEVVQELLNSESRKRSFINDVL